MFILSSPRFKENECSQSPQQQLEFESQILRETDIANSNTLQYVSRKIHSFNVQGIRLQHLFICLNIKVNLFI